MAERPLVIVVGMRHCDVMCLLQAHTCTTIRARRLKVIAALIQMNAPKGRSHAHLLTERHEARAARGFALAGLSSSRVLAAGSTWRVNLAIHLPGHAK